MMTEGLVLVTNDGTYAREMELPSNSLHRTYRARVHGRVTLGKLKAIRNGIGIDGTFYKGMKVHLELGPKQRDRGGGMRGANSWIQITCVEGKNRQIRRILDHLGLKVTRLIRTSFGDYDLNTIPPGMAIEVPVKPLDGQKKKGALSTGGARKKDSDTNRDVRRARDRQEREQTNAPTVSWVRYS